MTGQHLSAASQNEPRALRVSVWFGFAPAVAEVTVAPDGGDVKIAQAWLEPKSIQGRLGLSDSDLDKLALIRAEGPTTLRQAIELRAREEAFA